MVFIKEIQMIPPSYYCNDFRYHKSSNILFLLSMFSRRLPVTVILALGKKICHLPEFVLDLSQLLIPPFPATPDTASFGIVDLTVVTEDWNIWSLVSASFFPYRHPKASLMLSIYLEQLQRIYEKGNRYLVAQYFPFDVI